MLAKLIAFKRKLDGNWTYVHKILFSFAVYLLYKVFVRATSLEEMRPYSLIFILAGFYVYTLDISLTPVVDILSFFNKKQRERRLRYCTLCSLFFMVLTIIAVVAYYHSGYYPYIGIFIFSAVQSAMLARYEPAYFYEEKLKQAKAILVLMFVLGLAGVVHCFIYNDGLNVILFIYIIMFFVFDVILDRWQKPFAYE